MVVVPQPRLASKVVWPNDLSDGCSDLAVPYVCCDLGGLLHTHHCWRCWGLGRKREECQNMLHSLEGQRLRMKMIGLNMIQRSLAEDILDQVQVTFNFICTPIQFWTRVKFSNGFQGCDSPSFLFERNFYWKVESKILLFNSTPVLLDQGSKFSNF